MTYSPTQASRPLSPFPPPYSSLIPPSSPLLSESAKNNDVIIRIPVQAVRRTQSAADMQDTPEAKPLPAKLPSDATKEGRGETRRWNKNIFKLAQISTGIVTKAHKDSRRADPEINSNSEKGSPEPSPTVPATSAEGHDEVIRAKPEVPSHPADDCTNHTSKKVVPESENGSKNGDRKLTGEGEATFLKAWGLHITRDSDRERGYEILRELMAAESPQEEEHSKRMKSHGGQRDQYGRVQFTTQSISSAATRDRESLHVIEEEARGRGFHQGSARRVRGQAGGDHIRQAASR
ncbi:uncharacterized protein F4822DRAFT_433360 [Hypoxylon trugodes]|uniref:uncharacterized protein n=1 Tax=Hypoxylon trugodes TaxID=326681 RepID=UPI00219C03D6|nr:uncharacterized protein F4822DRAFT_433360 [Hypoxylon trugodes]KAI1384821.1 hypothetical protein F4822DRAFT_433360 [Hypoxylon trugodes]